MFNTIIVCMYNSMYNSINIMTNKTLHSMKLNITLQVFILSFCIDKQDKLNENYFACYEYFIHNNSSSSQH